MKLQRLARTWGTVPIEIGKNLALSVPLVAKLARRRHATGLMDRDHAVDRVFRFIEQSMPIAGKDLLEVGPGQTVKLLQRVLAAGARSARALDVVEYVDPPKGIEVLLYDGRTFPLPDESVDGIWSWDCFEHVRHPSITVAECARTLRPGGYLVLEIDVRDHRTADDARCVENLVYPTWLWNAMMWQRSAYTNRLRYSEWLSLFERNGLSLLSITPQESPTLRAHYGADDLSTQLSVEDYAITEFSAVLRKR